MTILDALFHISKGFYFGPHHLIMTYLVHFEEKSIGRSFRGRTPFHYYSRGYYAKSWSIWAFLLSLGSSVVAFVESDSLSTNGISWRAILHLQEPLPWYHLQCPHNQSRASSWQRLHLQCPHLRLLLLLRLRLLLFHQSRLLHPSLPSPYRLRSFAPLCIPFKHSPPHLLLSSSRWLRCVPIRTSRLL